MPNCDGIEFSLGEAFPPDSPLARWTVSCFMALNDLLLVNRWIIPRLEGKIDSESYENFYLLRLASMHLFEAATFLDKASRQPEIQQFVSQLSREAQGAYQALLKIARGQTGEFAENLERARNSFAHYSELLPDNAAPGDALRQAMQAHADEGTMGQIRDKAPPIIGFRALFVDDIAAEMMLPGGDPKATNELVGAISSHISQFLVFVRAALSAHGEELPEHAWDDWHEKCP